MRSVAKAAVAAACAALALSGCRSTRAVLADYENRVVSGQFAEAAVEPGKKADEGGRDALCWQLNAAAAERLAGNGDEAIRRFDLAEDLFSDHDGRGEVERSATGAYSLMSGDYVLPYAGAGQDRVFTCLYKAIDFGEKGKMAAVRTELNRAMLHQQGWLSEQEGEVAAMAERMRRDAKSYSASVATRAGGMADRALADPAFSARIWANADFDVASGGRLDLLTAADYTNGYLLNVNEIFRRDIGDSGPKPQDRVTVFVEDGLCPVREEWRIDLPTMLIPGLGGYVQYVGLALPKLRYRNEAVSGYSVTSGGANLQMGMIQDVDRLVRTEFDIYFRGALVREITRVIVRVGAQAALGVAADYNRHTDAGAVLALLQLGVAAYSYCTTEADVRSWTSLPKRVYMLDIPRPADGVVTVNCGNERLKLDVRPGNAMIFVRKTSSAAPAIVKSFTISD